MVLIIKFMVEMSKSKFWKWIKREISKWKWSLFFTFIFYFRFFLVFSAVEIDLLYSLKIMHMIIITVGRDNEDKNIGNVNILKWHKELE